MFFYSCVKGTSYLTYVDDLARTRDLIDASKLCVVNRIFNGSHFLSNGVKGFETGCNIILIEDSRNLICYPLDVR